MHSQEEREHRTTHHSVLNLHRDTCFASTEHSHLCEIRKAWGTDRKVSIWALNYVNHTQISLSQRQNRIAPILQTDKNVLEKKPKTTAQQTTDEPQEGSLFC